MKTRIRIGPDEGNSGAVFRWGQYLDKGFWITTWKFRRLWFRPKFRKGYIRLGPFVLQF